MKESSKCCLSRMLGVTERTSQQAASDVTPPRWRGTGGVAGTEPDPETLMQTPCWSKHCVLTSRTQHTSNLTTPPFFLALRTPKSLFPKGHANNCPGGLLWSAQEATSAGPLLKSPPQSCPWRSPGTAHGPSTTCSLLRLLHQDPGGCTGSA